MRVLLNKMKIREMSLRIVCGFAVLLCVISLTTTAHAIASPETEVRGAVAGAFQQLRSGNYDALYDVLPSATQKRLSRRQFTDALGRTRNLYELQRLEIGVVRVAGELAVVDSVIYARARAPFEGEGKIVLRQYLVREGGRWRVTTGDRAAIAPLLSANPVFAKKYPPTQPRLFLKRDGRWVEMSSPVKSNRRK